MKIAVLGRTQWLYDSALACTARGHEIVLIGTSQAALEYGVKEDDFAKLAEQLKCPFFCDPAINRPEYIRLIKDSSAEVAISVNWLTLMGTEVLKQFTRGVINAHAGDLPRFRGNAAPNWAILNDEPRIVVTLHQMVTELDAGPILLQREFPLAPDTYIAEVYKFMGDHIPNMFVEVLDRIDKGTVAQRGQSGSPENSLRGFPRIPRDGEINWQRSARELARLVRASAEPFSGAYSFIGTKKIIIWKAHSERLAYPYLGVAGQVAEIRRDSGQVAVLTGEDILVLEEVQTSSGRARASDVIQSSRLRLGMDMASEIVRLEERIASLEAVIKRLRDD